MHRKLIAIAGLAVVCMSTMAMPRPSEVKAAEARGDFVTAELLLKQVIAEKPTSGRAHSDLGVVYAREGKTDLAAQEAATAKQLDAKVVEVADVKKADEAKASSEFLYIVFGFPLLMIALWLAWVRYTVYRDKKLEKLQKDEDLKNYKTTLIVLAKNLEDAALIVKTATYADTDKAVIGERILVVQKQVRETLALLKDNADSLIFGHLALLKSKVEDLTELAMHGLPVHTPFVKETEIYQPSAYGNLHPRHNNTMRDEPAPTIVHHYHEAVPSQVAPVIVNNSGPDLLTVVMIDEILSERHEPTVIVERESDTYTRPSQYSSRRDDDDYSLSSKSSSSNDSYSSSSSSNDSYSSSSSSNDSYSSSSSSNDSYSSDSCSNDSY